MCCEKKQGRARDCRYWGDYFKLGGQVGLSKVTFKQRVKGGDGELHNDSMGEASAKALEQVGESKMASVVRIEQRKDKSEDEVKEVMGADHIGLHKTVKKTLLLLGVMRWNDYMGGFECRKDLTCI